MCGNGQGDSPLNRSRVYDVRRRVKDNKKWSEIVVELEESKNINTKTDC